MGLGGNVIVGGMDGKVFFSLLCCVLRLYRICLEIKFYIFRIYYIVVIFEFSKWYVWMFFIESGWVFL